MRPVIALKASKCFMTGGQILLLALGVLGGGFFALKGGLVDFNGFGIFILGALVCLAVSAGFLIAGFRTLILNKREEARGSSAESP